MSTVDFLCKFKTAYHHPPFVGRFIFFLEDPDKTGLSSLESLVRSDRTATKSVASVLRIDDDSDLLKVAFDPHGMSKSH